VSPRWAEVPPCPPIVPDPAFLRASRLARAVGRTELADEFAMAAHGIGWHALDPFPGYTGKPHLARAAAGAVFTEQVARGYATLIEDVVAGRREAPTPPMRWIAALTLEGRLVPRPTRAVQPATALG
jgi:hypothetical protein